VLGIRKWDLILTITMFEFLDTRHTNSLLTLCRSHFIAGQGLFCLSGKELTPSRDEGEAETSVVQDSLDNSVNPHTAEEDPLAGFLPSPPHTLCSDELKVCYAPFS
jgi:hypothetical protein